MSKELDTSYKSRLYYDVVIKTGKYKEFHTSWVGNGSMIFTNGKETIRVEDFKQSINWMKECWEKFIEDTKEKK